MKNQQSTLSLIESDLVKVIHISQFLPIEERDILYNAVCKEQSKFKKIDAPGTDIESTRFLKLKTNKENQVETNLIQNAYENLSKRIINRLPSLLKILNIEPFTVSEITLTLVSCFDGHYGTPHADSPQKGRQISILYYFNRTPKAFKGGDLELFNFDDNSTSGHSNNPFFTIDFEDNLLICFASETFHGITEVKSSSNNFEDGRFIAVGFIQIP